MFEVFCTKGVLRNFAKFTGKHLCQSLFFNKVAGFRPATLLKKRLWYRCFLLNFAKLLRIPFLQNTSSGIRQKVESQNGCFKKAKSGGKKCVFFGNFGVLCLLVTASINLSFRQFLFISLNDFSSSCCINPLPPNVLIQYVLRC